MDGAGRRLDREQRGRAWQAWHAGLLSHDFKDGQFPPLHQLMGDPDPAEVSGAQSDDEIEARMRRWEIAINTHVAAMAHVEKGAPDG